MFRITTAKQTIKNGASINKCFAVIVWLVIWKKQRLHKWSWWIFLISASDAPTNGEPPKCVSYIQYWIEFGWKCIVNFVFSVVNNIVCVSCNNNNKYFFCVLCFMFGFCCTNGQSERRTCLWKDNNWQRNKQELCMQRR